MATWAKGLDFKNKTNTTVLGGVGLFGNDTTAEKVFIGLGADPWNNKGLELTADTIRFKGTDVSLSGHTHNYLPTNGGTITASSFYGLTLKRSDSNGSAIQYSNSAGALGGLGFLNDGSLVVSTGSTTGGDLLKITKSTKAAVFGGTVTAPTFNGALSGNATTATSATTLQTARTINGTSFNGSTNITTANWGTTRTLTIGSTGKSVNGSGNVSWTLSEIGAAESSHTHSYLPLSGGTLTGRLIMNNSGRIATFGSTSGSPSAAIANQNSYIEITAPTNSSHNSKTGLVFHNSGTSSSVLEYVSTDSSNGYFNFRSDDTSWNVRVNGSQIWHNGNLVFGTGESNMARGNHTHSTLTRGSYLTGSNYNGGAATTWAVDATTAATASKVVARDGNADIFCRLVRSNYQNQSTISGAMAFRVNNSGDEYIRFCSDTAAIRTFLGVPASSHTHSYVPLAGGDMTGNLKFTGANGIVMKSGTTEAKTLWSHNNGHITLGAVNGDLYLGFTSSGYGTTSKIRLEKDTYTNAGATRVIDTSGKLYYQGNDIDSRYDRAIVTTITKSLTLTTNWIDTGITGTNLSTGTYAVQMLINDGTNTSQYQEYYSGMMSWFAEATNSSDADEILLHKAGHASNGRHAYLRVLRLASPGNLKLQIAFTHTCTAATSITFKFKKLI